MLTQTLPIPTAVPLVTAGSTRFETLSDGAEFEDAMRGWDADQNNADLETGSEGERAYGTKDGLPDTAEHSPNPDEAATGVLNGEYEGEGAELGTRTQPDAPVAIPGPGGVAVSPGNGEEPELAGEEEVTAPIPKDNQAFEAGYAWTGTPEAGSCADFTRCRENRRLTGSMKAVEQCGRLRSGRF